MWGIDVSIPKETYMPTMEQVISNLEDMGGSIVLASVILLVVFGLYLLSSRILAVSVKRKQLPEKMVRALRRILRWGALVVAVLLLLQAFGLLGSAVTALASIFALVAIGFVAVWSVLSNTLCSLILLITRPFRVGDMIRFPGDDIEGKVVNFNMVFTTMKTDDAAMVEIPNNLFFQRLIVRIPAKHKPIELGEQLYEEKDAKV